MINKSMKKYQDILNEASQAALNEINSKKHISKIVDILESSEKYLGRPLSESEVYSFTEILLEDEAPTARKDEKDKKEGPVFKKGSYKIEIITPQGKVIRTATSQKGLLDVIHSAKTFRVLDSNNRDITSKVKTFVKEREKQVELRKKLKKKSKLNENWKKKLVTAGLSALLTFAPAAERAAARTVAPAVAQGVVQVEKQAVQQGVKAATQQAAQTATKQAVQTGTQQAVKAAEQQAVKTATQQAAKTAEKQAVQTGTKKALNQEIKQGVQQGVKAATQQAAKEGVKATSQQAAKEGVKATATQAAKEGVKATSTQAATAATAATAAKAATTAPTPPSVGGGKGGVGGSAPAKVRAALFGGGSSEGRDLGFSVGSNPYDVYNDTLETQARTGVGGTIYYA